MKTRSLAAIEQASNYARCCCCYLSLSRFNCTTAEEDLPTHKLHSQSTHIHIVQPTSLVLLTTASSTFSPLLFYQAFKSPSPFFGVSEFFCPYSFSFFLLSPVLSSSTKLCMKKWDKKMRESWYTCRVRGGTRLAPDLERRRRKRGAKKQNWVFHFSINFAAYYSINSFCGSTYKELWKRLTFHKNFKLNICESPSNNNLSYHAEFVSPNTILLLPWLILVFTAFSLFFNRIFLLHSYLDAFFFLPMTWSLSFLTEFNSSRAGSVSLFAAHCFFGCNVLPWFTQQSRGISVALSVRVFVHGARKKNPHNWSWRRSLK